MEVCWCCSTRISCARGLRSGPFMRSATCLVRMESDSMPLTRMTRTLVKASSSSLLMGLPTISFHVKRCFSKGVPLSCNRLMVMSSSFQIEPFRRLLFRRRGPGHGTANS